MLLADTGTSWGSSHVAVQLCYVKQPTQSALQNQKNPTLLTQIRRSSRQVYVNQMLLPCQSDTPACPSHSSTRINLRNLRNVRNITPWHLCSRPRLLCRRGRAMMVGTSAAYLGFQQESTEQAAKHTGDVFSDGTGNDGQTNGHHNGSAIFERS